jgi:hypothetical protein
MRPIAIVKFIGAWFFLIAAVVIIVLGHAVPVEPMVLAVVSVAFAMAPASW